MQIAATSDHLVLLGVFFGFYLIDCVVLLQPAQALASPTLLRRKRGEPVKPHGLGFVQRCRMSVDFGLTVYPVRGRYLAVLNPLTPFAAVFKTRPIADSGGAMSSVRPLSLRQMIAIRIRMARMRLALISHAVLTFAVLPWLLISGDTTRLLIALGAAFLSAIMILAICFAERRAARLSLSGFWTIAGQALLCLPTSLNAPRKLAYLSTTSIRADELLPLVPEEQREGALSELRLTLDRAATDGAQDLEHAAESLRRHLATKYPEP